MTSAQFRNIALSFENTEEAPHFERTAFKVIKKRIFATLLVSKNIANLKLPLIEQSVFSDYGDAVYPVDNKWGKQGWTTFKLEDLPEELINDALQVAYRDVMKPKK